MPRSKQFNEKEVLNKAMELFWQKGFHATSMQDLVTCLGINRASLYDTFGGKEALFEAAFESYRNTCKSGVKQLFDEEDSVRTGFQKLFEKAIQESVEDECRKGCFVVNTTTELMPGDASIHQILLENKNQTEKQFTSYVQKGIDSGELDAKKDANEIGMMLFVLFNGIRVLAKVDPDPKKLRAAINSGLSILD